MTSKANKFWKGKKILQKNVAFLQNELIGKDEVIKTLLETQTSILQTVSNSSVGEEEKYH